MQLSTVDMMNCHHLTIELVQQCMTSSIPQVGSIFFLLILMIDDRTDVKYIHPPLTFNQILVPHAMLVQMGIYQKPTSSIAIEYMDSLDELSEFTNGHAV